MVVPIALLSNWPGFDVQIVHSFRPVAPHLQDLRLFVYFLKSPVPVSLIFREFLFAFIFFIFFIF